MPSSEQEDFQVKPNGPLTPQAVARLKAIKDSTGMSYAALGKSVGLSGTFLYNLMNKSMNVGTQHIMRMVEAVNRLEDPTTAASAAAAGNDNTSLTHEYHLRPALKVSIELPADITEKEAERLSLFIRSLPCE